MARRSGAEFKTATAAIAAGLAPAAVDRRVQIANAAALLFAEYGYEATSVRQIADQVGMLPGSLYNHFATKEDMLHAVVRLRIEHLEQLNSKIARLPGNAEQRLLANAIMRIHHYVKYRPFHTLLLHEGPFFQRRPDFEYVVAGKARISAIQLSIMRGGMQTELFRSDMDARLMIGTLSRMLSGVTMWQAAVELDALVDFHLDCVLRLVRLPARLHEPVPRALCERLLNEHIGEDWQH
jgi:AcrR family transcriptional regulator